MRRLLRTTLALFIALPLFATEPNPSVHQRQLAEKLLVAMKIDDTVRSTMDAMYAQMEKQFIESATANGTDEDSIAEAKETFRSFRQKASKLNLSGELRDAYVRMYAKYFSEKELGDLITFYESPTGSKTMDVLPQMMQESMQAGMQHLSPLLQQAMQEALEEQEQKRPWRKTMADMRTVATAVEAYAIDHDDAYPSGDYDALKPLLEPTYIKKMPPFDMWKHPYAYVASDDHAHYRIVSAGADTIFEWDSRRIVPLKEGQEPSTVYRDRLEADVIFAAGTFLQAPAQSKEKTK